jgi:hypothetical protein
MDERHLKRMRLRAVAANAFPRCDMPPGVVCHNDTRGHWHSGPAWLMEKAEKCGHVLNPASGESKDRP